MVPLEFAINILLVAQAAFAAAVALRLAWFWMRVRDAATDDPMLLAACLAVALVSIASVLLSRRRHRTLRHVLAHNDTLRVEVDTDGLTGLGNRRSFDAAVAACFERAVRERLGLALIVIDIDHFKSFNDSYGHVEGDHVLRATAQAIQSVLAGGNRAYRIGGEEMAVLLPGTPIVEAARQARLIQGAVEAMRRPHRRGEGGIVTVSIGVAEGFPAEKPLPPETLIAAADRAMYEAKAAGRACVRLASVAAGAQAASPAGADDESVDGLDILLPNGSKLKINSRLRLSTVGTILQLISHHAAAEGEAAPLTRPPRPPPRPA